MSLPAPWLDDRTFQDLVDEAKRLVQRRCPEWSDHNVSDPGVTLIEAFAQMLDQVIYRLNRVPERHYVKFLELLGVRLRPPAAARGQVTFWLSAPQPQTVRVRAETQVATPRTDVDDAVVLATTEDLDVVACSLARAGAALAGRDPVDRTASLGVGGFACFAAPPVPGDALLVGLSAAVPSCAVLLRVDCPVAGVGVDPDHPPLAWEAWTGAGWRPCEVERDLTFGLNRPGDVVLHVPRGHQTSVLAGERAGWLRCRLTPTAPEQPTYTEPPLVRALTAATIGGTTAIAHAEVVREEALGRSDGTPAQRFALQRRPVVAAEEPGALLVDVGGQVQEWTPVEHFADSGPTSRHYLLDPVEGEVQLGPAVREADGSLRHFGAVPPEGALLRLSEYRTGGGRHGNVARGQVRVLKTSVPYVARVENREPAVGGADGESVADASVRGPVLLRSRGRAVTAEDFEHFAREAAPGAARVHCLAAGAQGGGVVRLLVVPRAPTDAVGAVAQGDLQPPEPMLAAITAALDERRLVGTRLLVGPPHYEGLTVVVSVRALRRAAPAAVKEDVLRALHRLLSPVEGGPDGTGWPFGRPVRAHEVHAALAAVPGVDMASEVSVQLFPADLGTGARSAAVEALALPAHGLVLSYAHQVRVQPR